MLDKTKKIDLKKIDLKNIKWLIPALAVLVILESVLIVDKLSKSRAGLGSSSLLPTTSPQIEEEAVLSVSGSQTAVNGEESEITIVLRAIKNLALDGADLVIAYDSKKIEVIDQDAKTKGVQVKPGSVFSLPVRNSVDSETGQIGLVYVEMDRDAGVEINAGEEVSLAKIIFKPIEKGEVEWRILSGQEKGGSVLAENGTGRKVVFGVEDLSLTVK